MNFQPLFYKLVNGKVFPCKDVNDFKEAFEADRKIDKTEIDKDCSVSTVFLVVDHNFLGSSKTPVLFETMIFGGECDGQTYRYTKFGEAKRSHWAIVEALRKKEKPEGGFNIKKMLDDINNNKDDADWWKEESDESREL
jgi:hypothetical protein